MSIIVLVRFWSNIKWKLNGKNSFPLNTSSSISSEFALTDRPKLLQFGEKEIIGEKHEVKFWTFYLQH